MRSIKVVFAALALSTASVAFAAAAPADQTVTLTNNIADTLTTDGSVNVEFSALGTGTVTGSPTLAYSTHSDKKGSATTGSTFTRKVTVAATLPSGMLGNVKFTTSNGTSASSGVALGGSADFITAIPQFITQNAAALTYEFVITKGFVSSDVTVIYTLADE